MNLFISLAPTFERNKVEPLIERGRGGASSGDNLQVESLVYRIDNESNNWENADVNYKDLLHGIQRIVYRYIPQRSNSEKDYRVGDNVEYSTDGKNDWNEAKIVEITDEGYKLDAGLAPVIYVNAKKEQIRKPSKKIAHLKRIRYLHRKIKLKSRLQIFSQI